MSGDRSGPGGPDGPDGPDGPAASGRGLPAPRIPPPRAAADDSGFLPEAVPGSGLPGPRQPARSTGSEARPSHPEPPRQEPPNAERLRPPSPDPTRPPSPDPARPPSPDPTRPPYEHKVLKSLLGAWALAACSGEETAAVEAHLTDCAQCAGEALRLRDAVGLLQRDHNLDLNPLLRSRVLGGCLSRRPARIPVPEWAIPYDAETARLDALLRDMGAAEWRAPVRLKWFEGERTAERESTVGGVLGHLMAVDGAVAAALGLDDPLGSLAPAGQMSPAARTEAYWCGMEPAVPGAVHEPWRAQAHTLIRTVSFAGRERAEIPVPYGGFALPLRDSLLDRAFECWVHAGDIAEAIAYPYEPPASAHLKSMIDLAVRMLPGVLAKRRQAGLAGAVRRSKAPGAPGRALHLEVEGSGGGHYHIALDSPEAEASAEPSENEAVAHVALDGVEFCRLAAGHVSPEEAAAGQHGDREAIHDVLSATASLSRL